MAYRQPQRHEEVHEHLGEQRPIDHASVAAELPQDAVARCRIGRLGELLDGQNGCRGNEEDEADVKCQVRDHEAQPGRLGEHFVRRENARDRPQEARVGVVGALGALLEPAHVPRLQRGHDVVQGRVVLAGGLAVVGVHHVQVLGVGNAALCAQGFHGLVGGDDDQGRGRHGVVLQLRVVQRAGQRVVGAGDGHRGSRIQHGLGQGRHHVHVVRQGAGARCQFHGILAL